LVEDFVAKRQANGLEQLRELVELSGLE